MYHDSFEIAWEAITAYKALNQAGNQRIFRNSVDLGLFKVLGVTEAIPPFAVYNVVGFPTAQCRAEVKWTVYKMD
jgi:hypothetical protein